MLVVCLLGCDSSGEIEKALYLRERLLEAQECAFHCTITADYTDSVYTFAMSCEADKAGNLSFTVEDPEAIVGVSGDIGASNCHLTFDDQILVFPHFADGQIAPVTAPWLLLKTLRSGYISGAQTDGSLTHLIIDDSYDENPILLDIWIDDNRHPVRGEILYKGRRILSVDVRDFTIT